MPNQANEAQAKGLCNFSGIVLPVKNRLAAHATACWNIAYSDA